MSIQTDAAAGRREAAFHALVAAGMAPDRDLVDLIDLSAIRDTGAGFVVPHGFAARVRRDRPAWFGDTTAADTFDARTASEEEVAERLRAMERESTRRRYEARTAAELAGLQRRYGKAS